MPNPERSRIVIDSSPLRYLHTGLGQFTFHLLNELSKLPFPEAILIALVHPRYSGLIPDGISPESATWLRRHAPAALQSFLHRDCKVWHMTAENNRLTGVPKSAGVVLTLHGLHFLDEASPKEAQKALKKVQMLVDRANVITVVSHFTETLIRAHLRLGTTPIHVIPNGVSFEKQPVQKPSWAPKDEFLFSIGTFFPRKNFHVLVPMMKYLPEYKLVLAGDSGSAYAMQVMEEVRNSGLSDRVLFPGEVTQPEKQWLFEHGKALLFPSLSEGFGIPVIEAFHHGKPAVCSRFGSLPEIGGEHAAFWEDETPQQMATTVRNVLSRESPQLVDSRKVYARRFSWAAAAKSYQEIYRSLL
ncbi:MAG: glycosyltransferase family 4 protein [Cyclobacteriaceae bacterium]|nr:glycosyltransferase family 4 protein [Cyclobacteriaceae bacterium]